MEGEYNFNREEKKPEEHDVFSANVDHHVIPDSRPVSEETNNVNDESEHHSNTNVDVDEHVTFDSIPVSEEPMESGDDSNTDVDRNNDVTSESIPVAEESIEFEDSSNANANVNVDHDVSPANVEEHVSSESMPDDEQSIESEHHSDANADTESNADTNVSRDDDVSPANVEEYATSESVPVNQQNEHSEVASEVQTDEDIDAESNDSSMGTQDNSESNDVSTDNSDQENNEKVEEESEEEEKAEDDSVMMTDEATKVLDEISEEKKSEAQMSLDGDVIEGAGVNDIDDLDDAEAESARALQKREDWQSTIEAKELIDAQIGPEMKEAYLNYAMSVIVARALPSAEDGLKPVHRRILWTMYKLGLQHNKQTKKSARIVGDTMGRFHPHGNVAIYDSMVRMAQDWSLRYPLVTGQGNFGSMDGDGAAADRYTEAKMRKISDELLIDIEKENVEMMDNYSNEETEPMVLPGKIPNLLLNGSSGIAVGMATNMPPHNLRDTCNAILHYIDNPEATIKELAAKIKAPDFPTGGMISGEFNQIYEFGKGKVVIDGKVEIEEAKKKEKLKIVIVEIPYQVNKSNLVEQIANLVRDKKLPDVSDIRDESSKGKVRVVVEMRRDTEPKFTINRLYKYTQLRVNFNANMLALVDRKPRVLTLRDLIQVYVDHRRGVIRKTKEFDLKKAEKRLHIVEGLLVAQANIDAVIALIRAANSRVEAAAGLMAKYTLSEKQVEAILDMRLASLTALEHGKLTGEEADLRSLIEILMSILGDEKLILKIIKEDLEDLKDRFGDNRKSKIIGEVGDFDEKDLVDKRDVVVTITDRGYIKRIDVSEYREQKRGGKGVIGSDLAEGDFVTELLTCSTHDYLLFFTDKGKVHWLKAHEVPGGAKSGKGKAVVNLLSLKDEIVTNVISVREFNDYLIMATEKGIVKKIELSAFSSPRSGGIKAIKLAESNDVLINVMKVKDKQKVLLVSKNGKAIRFNSDEVRPMGRASYGVTGLKMDGDDKIVSLEVLPFEQSGSFSILTVTKNGYGKRSAIGEYRLTGRAGKGVINMKVTDKTGVVVGSRSVTDSDTVIMTTEKGIVIRTPLTNVRIIGRATQGVKVINIAEGDHVSDIIRVPRDDKVEGIEEVNAEIESAEESAAVTQGTL
ncbi:MAG: DNA gyrase subunit A [Patescibacteria group bacterium]|jgi:DNA gyrase subunit A